MATQKNLNQTGWFYHAPRKAAAPAEPADLPPHSQIPGLSGDDMPYNPMEEPKTMVIKDTDSAYIRMAKMGGRQDLLRMRTPKEQAPSAKPYPRTDWYYLEDNRQQDEEEKQRLQDGPFEFSLPDYMVHQEYRPRGDSQTHGHSRNPLSRDTTTVYDREGYAATDKRVKVQESRPSGYGIRQEKQKDRKQKLPAMAMPERAKARQGELDVQRPQAKNVPKQQEEERPLMSKILSFGYGQDDLAERQKCMQQQEQQAAANAQKAGRAPPAHGRRAGSGQVSDAGSVRSQRSQYGRKKTSEDKERPDFFKLSKFNNVPPKVSSHREAEDIQPIAYNPTRDLSDLHVTPQPVAYAAAN